MEHNHTHNHENTADESIALLQYMAHHNAHHAEELHEIAERLPEEEAKLIHEAVALLNQSTEKIRQALAKSEV